MNRFYMFLRGLKHVWKLSSMDKGMKSYYRFRMDSMKEFNKLHAKVNKINNKIERRK